MILLAGLTLNPPARADATYIQDGAFDRDTVTELARRLSRSPFAAPKTPLPKALAGLDYEHYRDIRVRPSSTLWADQGTAFRLQVLPRGFVFSDPVEVALVAKGRCERIAYKPDFFITGDVMKTPLPTEDIGFSGFRVLFPINRRAVFDEVAVFQGASYFRSLGENQVYGLSARGLANKTAEPEGEEFPAFRAFWIEEPPTRATQTLVVHALLDSPSVAGAYRFEIHPGHGATRATSMDIEAVLFPRVELGKVGLAPATSMFMFSPNGRISIDDFRPEVHDSDGLLIFNGRGEHIWRPLQNPAQVEVSAFLDVNPAGFGLLQRDRNPADYQDFEAVYERRPSLWLEPVGDWGEGAVVLTEIPSDAEIHDNIVAFWRPKAALPAGAEYRYAYRASWGDGPPAALEQARVAATRRGRADVRGPTPERRFVIDYLPAAKMARAPRTPLPQAKVSASAGAIKDIVVADNPIVGGYRLSFVFDPRPAKTAELRAELVFGDRLTAETWVYRWTTP
ncbi:MAG TPA: glucan biosynthesis protein G [Polyangia bacterium]|nr:glucan biosynthesis protein G [Polyangia bacterium]